MTAKELAKEIADSVIDAMRKHGHFMERKTVLDVESAIAAKIDPLVRALEQSHRIVVDAIMDGMPITKAVAKARNDAVAILRKRGDQ